MKTVDRFIPRSSRHRTFFGPLSGYRSRKKALSAWRGAKQRCFNPNLAEYKNYGARGITMASRWVQDFDAFVAHVGYPIRGEVSLDRIDNDRGYVPGNVRWATFVEQQRNRRKGLKYRTKAERAAIAAASIAEVRS
jgi:hypothetical protein